MRLACWIRRHAETGSISTTFAADGSRVERKFAIAGRNRQTRETRALPRPNRNPRNQTGVRIATPRSNLLDAPRHFL